MSRSTSSALRSTTTPSARNSGTGPGSATARTSTRPMRRNLIRRLRAHSRRRSGCSTKTATRSPAARSAESRSMYRPAPIPSSSSPIRSSATRTSSSNRAVTASFSSPRRDPRYAHAPNFSTAPAMAPQVEPESISFAALSTAATHSPFARNGAAAT